MYFVTVKFSDTNNNNSNNSKIITYGDFQDWEKHTTIIPVSLN